MPGDRLLVRWAVESQPEDFAPVGGGVAYIYSKSAECGVRLSTHQQGREPG
jgi:hypothetical protein